MSSCVKPVIRNNSNPVVLLHCFDRFVVFESHTNTPWFLFAAKLGSFHCITQFLFRMEMHISLAGGGRFGGLGCGCSWMGFF